MEQYIDIGEFNMNPIKATLNAYSISMTNETRFETNYLSVNEIQLYDSFVASSFSMESYNYTKIRNFYVTQGARGAINKNVFF